MINELIDQIGGRERLEFIAENAISMERIIMARTLMAVLDAKPYAYEFVTSGKKQVILSRTLPPVDMDEVIKLYRIPPEASVPEWSNAQCVEFLTVAFRHCEIIGDIEMDDIRLGVKMANAAAPSPENKK